MQPFIRTVRAAAWTTLTLWLLSPGLLWAQRRCAGAGGDAPAWPRARPWSEPLMVSGSRIGRRPRIDGGPSTARRGQTGLSTQRRGLGSGRRGLSRRRRVMLSTPPRARTQLRSIQCACGPLSARWAQSERRAPQRRHSTVG